jgi:hypothetical protein
VPRIVANEPAANFALAIEREAESDAVRPSAEAACFPQRGKFLVCAEKCFLGDVLGVSVITKNAVRDMKNAALIFRDTRAESRVTFPDTFPSIHSRNSIRHAFPRLPRHPDGCKFMHRDWFLAAEYYTQHAVLHELNGMAMKARMRAPVAA